ncbi:HAD superfamily hydrolase (TIGR01490 family) [Evansella vedderi]|uniref:HAD superfamily hydrolase (TIGR01490 family) n=1 Tax=Evansella vedderi TaxID=38282 RepID=A0ABT9ZZT0_9BACI|nr:HAD family hydrolase [Evansella vedderi]MDQ0256753.1 HAD superfamily hydrolase (TIGR01490 family) [Evansella vedderi]
MAIVTVDFDGTLYQGNSFKIMFQMGKKNFGVKEWIVVFTGIAKALAVGVVRGKAALRLQFFRAFAKTFNGKTKEELDVFFQQLVNIGKKDFNHDLIHKLREHQEKGDTVIILSGALQPFLEAFTKEVQLDVHVISTELQLNEQGLCTGDVGEIINGEEKVRKVQEWVKRSGRGSTEIWAYADSESDIPLFHYVKYPIVVNPDSDMKKIAHKNKWPIFAAEKNRGSTHFI